MKKIFAAVLILFISALANAQEMQNSIQRLNFPYKNGYHMHFKGESRQYDHTKINPYTGKPKYQSEPAEMFYDINNQWMDGTDTVVNFKVTIVNGADTMIVNESPLVVNDGGMYFWSRVTKEDVYFSKESKKENKKGDKKSNYNYAIQTPFELNTSWESVDHSNETGTFTCIVMDTVLNLPAGEFHAFAIRSESIQQDEKDYQIVMVFVEYYAQGIGKIQTEQYTYAVVKKTGERQLLLDEIISLQKYWWD